MAVLPSPDPATLARQLSAALGFLAGARRALADDHLPHLEQLIGALERLQARLDSEPAPDSAGLQGQLLAVLDEAAGLARSLGV
jgi:hypothetical protein